MSAVAAHAGGLIVTFLLDEELAPLIAQHGSIVAEVLKLIDAPVSLRMQDVQMHVWYCSGRSQHSRSSRLVTSFASIFSDSWCGCFQVQIKFLTAHPTCALI